ncbi:MAG: hypothetical protein HUU15_10365 [Candidatus Brocadiae bacterium]|nr:hypothetical protein [Candidatus Brocadiia bacterium]
MPRLLALLSCALFLAAPLSAEDCPNCEPAKVCVSHEAGDDIAVKTAQIQLKTKDMMGKREAVQGLAEAQAKHMNCRSRKISIEFAKALADPDVDVKLMAAEKIATMGEPTIAVQALSQQVAQYRKLIGNTKPKKPAEQAAWDNNVKMLGLMYDSLATVPDPGAVKPFLEDLGSSSPFLAKAAADATPALKGKKEIIRALYDGMKKWLGPSQQPARPEGTVEAFFGMSMAMAKVVDNPPTNLDGKNQAQAMGIWDGWWEKNGEKGK